MTKVIGLTGGIASGKSTVTAFLQQNGYQVIDADAVVHELQSKGNRLYAILVKEFGPSILLANGQLDRAKLGRLVFSNEERRKRLSDIQDAIIRKELFVRKEQLMQTERVFFMDIPLLYELDYSGIVDEVWLVYVDKYQQLERLIKRNGYSSQEARNRIDAQFSLDRKKVLADKVIDNSGDLDTTLSQVKDYLEELENG